MKTKLNYPYFAHLLASFLLVCSPVLFFTACSDDDDGPVTEEEGVWDTPLRNSIATDDQVDNPAAILGDVPADMKEALDIRFTHFQNEVNEDTDILFLSSSALDTYNEEIVTVYENGGIIVIVRPETSMVNEWFEPMGWPYELANDGMEKELYAFSKNHQYLLDEAYEGITVNEHLNYFVNWVNESLKLVVVSSPGSEETAIDKLINAQTITHTFSYNLDIEEAKIALSKADRISGKGSLTAKYSIYALYAFEGQQSSGDYYIVSAEYTAHNDNMCPVNNNNHKWTSKHGGVYCRLCGFYMTNFKIETSLLKPDLKTMVGEYPVNYSPIPLTTQGATSYSSGISWNLGADVALGFDAAGPNGSITIKGGVTFSNEVSRTISDVEIMNQSTNNSTKYEYKVNNLPHYQSNISISDPPLVSVSNATFYSSWIWRVPETKDNSSDRFYIGTRPEITYGSCHFYSTGADFKTNNNRPKLGDVQYTPIIPPSRTPTGLLTITNTNEGEYISDVVIKNQKGEVEYSSSGKGSIEFESAFMRYIPTGEYTVEFQMGENAHSTKTYILSEGSLAIKRGETLSLNSAFDFEEKE